VVSSFHSGWSTYRKQVRAHAQYLKKKHAPVYYFRITVDTGTFLPALYKNISYVDAIQQRAELVPVLGLVDAVRRGAQDAHALLVQRQRQVVRDLPAHADQHAGAVLELVDVQHALQRQLLEVQLVGLVVVGAHGLGVVVDHDGFVPHGAHLPHSAHRAPVELHLKRVKVF
jgi:hypothetical protein